MQRFMKKLTIIVMIMLLVVTLSVDAKGKAKKQSKKSSNEKFMITAGGGVGINLIPSVFISYYDYYPAIGYALKATGTSIGFGLSLQGNFTFSWFTKSGWGIGAATQIGWGFLVGPELFGNEEQTIPGATTSFEYYAEDLETLDFTNTFIWDLNFCLRSPREGDMNFLLEAGVSMRPMWMNMYGYNSNIQKWADSYLATFAAGPNIFVGFDKYLNNTLDFQLGFRFSAVFGDLSYHNFPIDLDTYSSTKFIALLNFAIEIRLNWYTKF